MQLPFHRLPNLYVVSSVSQEETPAVCSGDRQSEARPLLHGAVEAKQVFYLLLDGENLFSIGTVKVNQERLIFCHQDVLELEVSVKESCFVKSPDENARTSDGFPFNEKIFTDGMGAHLLKILDQVLGTEDFQRQKIRPIEKEENRAMDSADGLDGWDPAGSDFLRQGQFSKGSVAEEIDISEEGSEYSSV